MTSQLDMTISIAQVAAGNSVDVPTVLRWIEEGTIPTPSIVGGFARWPAETLTNWVAASFPKSEPPTFCKFERIRLAYTEDSMLQLATLIANVGEERAEQILTEMENEHE